MFRLISRRLFSAGADSISAIKEQAFKAYTLAEAKADWLRIVALGLGIAGATSTFIVYEQKSSASSIEKQLELGFNVLKQQHDILLGVLERRGAVLDKHGAVLDKHGEEVRISAERHDAVMKELKLVAERVDELITRGKNR